MGACHEITGRTIWLALLAIGIPSAALAQLPWHNDAREVTCGVVNAEGTLFVGTLRSGLFAVDCNAPAATWHRVQKKDGLGQDAITAVHVDTQGRLWVGHQNAGVTVAVGGRFHQYPAGKGPLGSRVWDIAHCPVDGDVWIAHDRGLTRYGIKSGKWQHVTRTDGLPTCHVRCVTFDDDGTLVVGTQSEGLAVAKRVADAYPEFHSIEGPRSLTTSPTGGGLPSGLVNDVLIDRFGRWIVATDRGLAISDNKGESFTFHRGREWALKLERLYKPVKLDPGVRGQEAWLPDDYVSTLAEDADGRVWIGFLKGGVMALKPNGIQAAYHGDPRPQGEQADTMPDLKSLRLQRGYQFFGTAFFVRAVLPRPGQPTLALGYGMGGHAVAEAPVAAAQPMPAARRTPPQSSVVPRPDAPLVKTHGIPAELVWARKELDRVSKDEAAVVALPDDWVTQGDWIGTYGGILGVLCAAQSPESIYVGTNEPRVRYYNTIGPHRRIVTIREKETIWNREFDREDALRYWVWGLFTDDRRALQLPPDYVRRWVEKKYPMSEKVRSNRAWQRRPCGVDDHAEAYSLVYDGPSIQVALEVPDGVYQVAMYFLNYDGEKPSNRARDYRVLVHHHTNQYLGDMGDVEGMPLAHQARVTDFYGGVYKKMLVRGPLKLAIEVNRNHTFNTMLSGVFVDAWSEKVEAIVPPVPESLQFSIKP